MLKAVKFFLFLVAFLIAKRPAFAQKQIKDTLPEAITEAVHSYLRELYILRIKEYGKIKDSADLISRIPFIEQKIKKEYCIIDRSKNLFNRYRIVLVWEWLVDDGFRTTLLIDEQEKKVIAPFDSLAQFNHLLTFLNKPLSNFDKSLLLFSLCKNFGSPVLIKRIKYRSAISKSVILSNEINGSEIFGDYNIYKGNKFFRQFRKYKGPELCFALHLSNNESTNCVKEANMFTYKITTILFSSDGFVQKVSCQFIRTSFKHKKIEYLKNECSIII